MQNVSHMWDYVLCIILFAFLLFFSYQFLDSFGVIYAEQYGTGSTLILDLLPCPLFKKELRRGEEYSHSFFPCIFTFSSYLEMLRHLLIGAKQDRAHYLRQNTFSAESRKVKSL